MSKDLDAVAKAIRLNILKLAAKAGDEGIAVHIAPSLSIVEILAVIFGKTLRQNDIFILSKGHGGLAYYAALKEAGFITDEQLSTFSTDGSDFNAHPSKSIENGIISSNGSLGMGLSYACGLALAAKKRENDTMVYVLLGDGELNEGSNWEAIMFAKQQKLGNIVTIVDNNGMQSDGSSSDIISVDLDSAFVPFGWQSRVCDGHSTDKLTAALAVQKNDIPKVIIAKTVKGKGVSFMENNSIWHHNRLSNEQYQNALKEVNCIGL